MNDLDELLGDAFSELARQAPHDPDLAGTIRHRVRRTRLVRAGVTLAATVAVLAAGLATLPQWNRGDAAPPARQPVTVVPACEAIVTRAVLPEWARTGFSEPRPVMPFVRSRSGNVVAILFGQQLYAPASPKVNNKILWVWHELPADAGDVRMTARLNGTGPAVSAGLPVPTGPSIVDLPSPGCWRVSLTWAGGSDTLDLSVIAPR